MTKKRRLSKPPQATELQLPAEPQGPRQMFLHLNYHANNIPASIIRHHWEKYCSKFEQLLKVTPPTIRYHQPKNIGDITTQAKLHQAAGKEASLYMEEYQKGLDPWTNSPNIYTVPSPTAPQLRSGPQKQS